MSQDSSSLDCILEPDMTLSCDFAGYNLCRRVMSILTEASYTGEAVSSVKLLSAARQYAVGKGFGVISAAGNYETFKVTPPILSTTTAPPSSK